MPKAIVVYDSKSGNTEKMAVAIGAGIREAGVDVMVKRVENATLDDLAAADAIVLGSPTYFGNVSARIKALIDESIKLYPDGLKDKIGAAFTSAGGVADGCETALLSIIHAMLIHRMVIVGLQKGARVIGRNAGAFGAVSVQTPDEECLAGCREFGKRIASFLKRKL